MFVSNIVVSKILSYLLIMSTRSKKRLVTRGIGINEVVFVKYRLFCLSARETRTCKKIYLFPLV